MPTISVQTTIKAAPAVVFDLARSIDLHTIAVKPTDIKAVFGKTKGFIEMDDWVTWRGRYFGFTQVHIMRVTAYTRPVSFVNVMEEGVFKKFVYTHLFDAQADGSTLMTDTIEFTSPHGLVGRLCNVLFVKSYLTRYLERRNAVLKDYAENGRLKELL